MTRNTTSHPAMVETELFLGDDWFDPLEAGVRSRIRTFIEALLEAELDAALSRKRYERRRLPAGDDAAGGAPLAAAGHRHGRRGRTLLGTFGAVTVGVPRARLETPAGGTVEWKNATIPASRRRTKRADALIAGAYLAGTNTRRVRRALAALFGGAVGKDVVSRVWRKVTSAWEAWNRRSRAEEPIARLVLDGTVVRVRLDRKAASISLLVVTGVRQDGQTVLLAVKTMGGETTAAWRAILDDLIGRGLRTPEFLIVDGAPGLEGALAAVWPDVPTQRRAVHKHRNLLAHAPDRLHEEVSADYTDNDLRRGPGGDRGSAQGLRPQMAAEVPRGRRQPGGGRRAPLHLYAAAAEPVEERQDHERHRTAPWRVQAPGQDADGPTLRRDGGDAVLGAARLRPDHDAQGRRLADARRATVRSRH
jgi:putative transposase